MTPESEPDVLSYMGSVLAHIMTDNYDAAINDLNEIIRLDPNNDSAYAVRGEAYQKKGQFNEAISDFTEAIRLDPDYDWAYGVRGQVYKQLGQKKQGDSGF